MSGPLYERPTLFAAHFIRGPLYSRPLPTPSLRHFSPSSYDAIVPKNFIVCLLKYGGTLAAAGGVPAAPSTDAKQRASRTAALFKKLKQQPDRIAKGNHKR